MQGMDRDWVGRSMRRERIAHLTESVKSPGFDLDGRQRYEPSKPRSMSN